SIRLSTEGQCQAVGHHCSPRDVHDSDAVAGATAAGYADSQGSHVQNSVAHVKRCRELIRWKKCIALRALSHCKGVDERVDNAGREVGDVLAAGAMVVEVDRGIA